MSTNGAGSAIATGSDAGEARGPTNTSVIIGNLKRDVDKEALKALLCQLGRVTNFRLQQPPGIDPASPATGVVEYASPEDASRVVAHVHGKLILGRPVTAWVAAPGSTAPPLPQGAPPPTSAASATSTAGPGPARAAYHSEMDHRHANPNHDKNAGRYPPAVGHNANSHEDARWERPPPPQQGKPVVKRAPPPPQDTYGDGYSHNQRQQQQHQSWHSGRPMSQQSGANVPVAPRYGGEGGSTHYAERQWQDQRHGHGEADESAAWERPERNQFPAAQRAPMRQQPPPSFHRPTVPQTSEWYDDADSHVPHGSSAYDDGGQLRGPRGRAMMPRRASGGSVGVPPRSSDDGYGDDDVPAGAMRRPPPPNSASHGVPLPGHAAAWTDDAEYTMPPPISIKGEDFEKEVVKAAALLVAEREMAREEARKQGKQYWSGVDPTPGYEGPTKSKKARSGSRSVGEETDERKKREPSSRKDENDGDHRPKSKKTRRDSSGDRHGSVGKRADERKGKTRTREESKGGPQGYDRDRKREDSSRRSHKDKHKDSRSGSRTRRSSSRARDNDPDSSKSSPKQGSSSWDRKGFNSSPWENQHQATGGFYVHVGGLSFSTTFTTLAKRFAAFGDVNGFKVIFNKVSCSAEETSKRKGSKEEVTKAAVVTASSGFAFISFDNERGMEKAVECMDGQKLDGNILKVTRGGRLQARPHSGGRAFRAQAEPTPPNQGPPRRWQESKGNHHKHEHEQEYHPNQARHANPRSEPQGSYTKPRPEQQGYHTKPRPEQQGYNTRPRPEQQGYNTMPRPEKQGYYTKPKLQQEGYHTKPRHGRGDRRSVELIEAINEPAGGSGRRKHADDKDRGATDDPLGALRCPRPSATSRKEASGSVKPAEVNGRIKIGYGGKSTSRDATGGNGDSSFRKVNEPREKARPSNTGSSDTRRITDRLGSKT
ncbi:unnamed protein product [Ectocarpus sp. 12 AP-2014]